MTGKEPGKPQSCLRVRSESAHGWPYRPAKNKRHHVMPARTSEPGCRKKKDFEWSGSGLGLQAVLLFPLYLEMNQFY
jgi:hypothetical protein